MHKSKCEIKKKTFRGETSGPLILGSGHLPALPRLFLLSAFYMVLK